MANDQYGYPDPNQPQYPASQPSASQPPQGQYPTSQPSASQPPQGQYPTSQPSASQPPQGQFQPGQPQAQGQQYAGQQYGGQQYAGQQYGGQQQFQGGFDQGQGGYAQGQGGFDQGQQFGNQQLAQQPGSDDLGAVFDFSFTRFATPAVAKIVYIIAIVVGVLQYLIGGISLAMTGASAAAFGQNPLLVPTIGWFVVGLGVLALWITGVRMILELAIANIRTSEHTRDTLAELRNTN